MFTIEEIRGKITSLQTLASVDPEAALKGTQTLFFDLLRQDCDFYIIPSEKSNITNLRNKDFRPYIARIQSDDPRTFLRVFTHTELAKQFGTNEVFDLQICPITAIELLQLAKYWFLHGVYGFILNDGDVWTVTSFPEILKTALNLLLREPDLYNEEYVQSILLIHQIRHNSYYHMAILKGSDSFSFVEADDSTTYVFQENVAMKAGVPSAALVPIVLQDFYSITTETVSVQTDSRYIIKTKILQSALQACGIEPDETPLIRPLTYVDESETLSTEDGSFDFHSIRDLRLDVAEKENERDSPKTVAIAMIPAEKAEEENRSQKFIEKSKLLFSQLLNKTRHVFLSIKELKYPHPKIILLVCSAVVLLVVSLLFLERSAPLQDFREALSSCDYAEAYTYYCDGKDKETFRESADEVLLVHIDKLVKQYQMNEVEEVELSANLSQLRQFDSVDQQLTQAQQSISRLHDSKNCYKQGKHAASISQRLKFWSQVIEDDTENFQIVQEDLKKNETFYINKLIKEIETLKDEGKKKQALDVLMIAMEVYPGDTIFSELLDSILLESEVDSTITPNVDTTVSEQAPIRITALSVSLPDWQSGVDVRLSWKNTSIKTIKIVNFYLEPVDERGKVVTCRKRGYSIYCAQDIGPYESGKGSPENRGWIWEDAWYNPNIASVALRKVEIIFDTGEAVTLENASELQTLF